MGMDTDEVVFIVEQDEEAGGYSAVCQRYGIFTQGEDLDDLRAMVKDAVACRFDGEPGQARCDRDAPPPTPAAEGGGGGRGLGGGAASATQE